MADEFKEIKLESNWYSSSALESSVLEIPKRVKWAKIIDIWTHPLVMVHGSRSHWWKNLRPQQMLHFGSKSKLLFGETSCNYFVQEVHQTQSLHMKAGKTTAPSAEAENWTTGKRAVIDIKYFS